MLYSDKEDTWISLFPFSGILRAGGGAAELIYTCGPLCVAARAVVVFIVLVQWFPQCSVPCGPQAICEQFPEVLWMHVCNGYFEVYLRL